MGMFNFINSLYKTHVNNVAKASNQAFNDALRPVEELGYGPRVNQHLYNPLSIVQLYTLAFHSDVISTIQFALRRETFRNGVELVDADNTDSELQTSNEGSEDSTRQNDFLDWMQNVNENSQTFIEVLEECEDDLNTADDMFMLFLFDYTFDNDGRIASKNVQELLRMHPALMQFVINKQDRPGFTDDGMEIVACPLHREQVHEVSPDMEHRCPLCDRVMYRAHYRHNGTAAKYYFKHEVFHMSRYRPSRSRGFSPINAIFVKQQTLKGQDEYVYELYNGKKPPKSMLVFNTSNQETLKKAWQEMLERTKVNRHLPAILGMESGPNSKNVAQFFDFMRSLDELQFTEQRNEYRNVIGAVFGVMPIWQGDLSTGGGLNNEGMEITIGNRTMEYNQGRYNDKCFPFVLNAWGLQNSILKCRPSEEQDEKAKLERQRMSLENGEIAVRVGLVAKYDSDLGEVVIDDGPLEKAEVPNAFGGGFGNDEPPSDDNSGSPDLNTDEQSGRPVTDLSNDIVKSSLPEGAISIKPGTTPPKGAKIITGPKGGKYYVSGGDTSGQNPQGSTSSSVDSKKYAIEKYSQIPSEIKKKIESNVNAWRTGAHVVLPVSYVGKTVSILTPEETQQMSDGVLDDMISADVNDPASSHIKKLFEDEFKNTVSVEKSSPQERKAFSDLKNIIDREVDEFIKTYKRKPTQLELEAKIRKINSRVATNLIATSKPFIERAYKIIAQNQASGLGVSFSFDAIDQNAVAILQNSAELNQSFISLSNKMSEKISDVIRLAYETPKGLNLQDMKQKIAEIAELSDSRAENIARSETNNISAAARRSSYKKSDPENTLKYKHIGPLYTGPKGRTTLTSKNIMDRTINGVSWDEYVRIVKEESAKEFPTWTVNPDFPVSHWQSRHTFVGFR